MAARFPVLRALYSVTLAALLPAILLRLAWRGWRQRGYWRHIGERFGRYPAPLATDVVWVHAVSVGELRAAQPLVRLLMQRFPSRRLLVTCMTAAGRDTADELYGESAQIAYLPYDFFRAHRNVIRHFKPAALLVLETEIWPNLLAACAAMGVPAALVNARLSQRSYDGYARFGWVRSLVGQALATLRITGAQHKDDASRLSALGANPVTVTGNIKFDMPIDEERRQLGAAWRMSLPREKRVFLCCSTRDGEEALLLDAYRRAFPSDRRRGQLLVIVPRHPQRFEQVFALAAGSGLSTVRRSDGPAGDAECWIGDSMGEVPAYVAMCDVAFVGGSLLPLGGQNLIEVCALGKPVLMGKSVFNFADAARQAEMAGALTICPDADRVMSEVVRLFDDEPARLTAAEAALAFAAAHRGATEKTMGLIAPLFESPTRN